MRQIVLSLLSSTLLPACLNDTVPETTMLPEIRSQEWAKVVSKKGQVLTTKPLKASIPQIDLNHREDMQIVISCYKDMYCGHPSSVLLEDGKTMTMMYLNQHGCGFLNWKRSFDGGLTWSEHLPVPHDWNEYSALNGKKITRVECVKEGNKLKKTPRDECAFGEVPTLYRIKDPKGKERVLMYTGKGAFCRYAVSEDGGATWSKLRPLLFNGKKLRNAVTFFSDLIRLKDGTYMGNFHDHLGRVHKAVTSDGMSFSATTIIADEGKKGAFLCEGAFIRSPEGKSIALLMRENNRSYNSMISFSEDEGKTWSKPREMPAALTGDRHQHSYTPDGRLFVTFRNTSLDKAAPWQGDWCAWVGTFKDLQTGAEGQYNLRLKENFRGRDCAYPTVKLLPDGSIFAATYGKWYKDFPNAILSVRLKMNVIDKIDASGQ